MGSWLIPVLVIHAGCPRTATTSIQKHILPNCNEFYFYNKKHLNSGALNQIINSRKSIDILRDIQSDGALDHQIFCLTACAFLLAIPGRKTDGLLTLLESVVKITNTQKKILVISNERLCDTSASLDGERTHMPGGDHRFPLVALAESLQSLGANYKVCLCFRDPIPYLTSKYFRTAIQRKAIGREHQSAFQYISNQIQLEDLNKESSAIAPAFHKKFIQYLSTHAPRVAHFGFQDLVHSDDVLGLMGISCSQKMSLKEHPIENQTKMRQPLKDLTSREIFEALAHHRLLEEIKANQIYR